MVTLNRNEIFQALANLILYEYTNSKNIGKGFSKLIEAARKDAALYGDTIIIRDVDAIMGTEWQQDSDYCLNLLQTHRPTVVEDTITLDKFRFIPVTTDEICTKRAFLSENGFADFTSMVLKMLADSQRIMLQTNYNTFIGTDEVVEQNPTPIAFKEAEEDETPEQELARHIGDFQKVAKEMTDLTIKLMDPSREFNENHYLRAFDAEDIKIIWNADYLNQMSKLAETTMCNPDKLGVKEFYSLPARYFGTKNTTVVAAEGVTEGKYRAVEACECATETGGAPIHLFAGDEVPAGCTRVKSYTVDGRVAAIESWPVGSIYEQDAKVIAKIYTELPPLLINVSSTEAFYNAKNRSTNYYALVGHNTLKHLRNFPLITIRQA